MKAVIIYDSVYGNTEKIARAMKDALAPHEVEIARVADADMERVRGADLLVVGSPTHGGRPTPAIKDFLNRIPDAALEGMRAVAFDTGIPRQGQGWFLKLVIGIFGYAARHIASSLEKKRATILGAETFYVLGKEGPVQDGEPDRVQTWIAALLEQI